MCKDKCEATRKAPILRAALQPPPSLRPRTSAEGTPLCGLIAALTCIHALIHLVGVVLRKKIIPV